MTQTVHALISEHAARLAAAGIENARLDVEVLLMHLLDVDRAHLYVMLPETAPDEVVERLQHQVELRMAGEPVAYLTGCREFMGFDFAVDHRVLIPRPETEGLVSRALDWLERHPDARRVVDVGTGSGAIAISLDQLTHPGRTIHILASDISREALEVAQLNRNRLGSERTYFINGSLLDWCRGPLDLIVANLPYLREEQRHAGIGREPDLALYAAGKGFALYHALIPQAAELLADDGALMCEIDPDQREMALQAARGSFHEANVRIETDLSGRDRYLIVENARSGDAMDSPQT